MRLRGRRYNHIIDIHRVHQGKDLIVGQVNHQVGKGRITKIEDKFLEMDVAFVHDPPPALDVILILALARPIVLKRILADVTSMGIKKIFLVHSARVEKSFWKSHSLDPENIRQQLFLGLEQAKDTMVPEVFLKRRFKPFVEDELPYLAQGRSAWVAHPGASEGCPRHIAPPALLFIGPEGGWVPYEINLLEAQGLRAFHLGSRILRVETCVPYLISRFHC